MSGIFSVLGDSQTGLYRLKQASRYADPLDGPKTVQEQLADKQRGAALPFSLAPRDQRNANAAMSAMEEAKRIASPKAHAEQRLAEVERRLEELRAEMRLAAAQGDREKVMELAREAAQLAREAGRAAKAYAGGMSAAAAMGKGATEAGTVETVRERSTTTLTIASVETSVELRIGSGASGEPAGGAPTAPSATTPSATVPSAEDGMQELLGAAQDLLGMAEGLLPQAAGAGANPAAATSAKDLVGRMIGDNDLKLTRYKEADAFGRRVETVLATVKNVLSEAKATNESDLDESRRRERRKQLDGYDKVIADAQEEVNALRGAALDSAVTPQDLVGAIIDATIGGGATVAAPAAATAAAPAPAPAPVVDLLL